MPFDPLQRFEQLLARLLSDAADDGSLQRLLNERVAEARAGLSAQDAAKLDAVVEKALKHHGVKSRRPKVH